LARIEYEFKMKKDMKKILFAIPLFAMLLVACDPIVDEIRIPMSHRKILLLNLWPRTRETTTFRLFLLRHVM
jgi:hypothetical protein